MKAIIEACGKQYSVEEGKTLYVEKMDTNAGEKVVFDKVLMVDNKIGTPYVSGAKVVSEVEKFGKTKKILVYKYNAKKQYRKLQGHRQPYTKVVIKKIEVK